MVDEDFCFVYNNPGYYDMKTSSEQTVYILGNTTEDTGYCVESLSSNLVENLMFL